MITELFIKNFAIIDEVRLEFLAPGLNVLTGETGSGKSIVLGALACILGERASPDLVRGGADKCTVEAILALPDESPARAFLRESELEGDGAEAELIVRRDIYADGRSRAFINGFSVPLNKLKDLGDLLVDLHGQHQHQSLLRPEAQLQWLDKMAGTEAALREFAAAHQRYLERLREREAITQRERERTQRLDFLRYQVEEIEAANLGAGEEESLEAERKRLSNLERLREGVAEAMGRISEESGGDGSVQAALGEAMRALQPIADWDEHVREALGALGGAQSLAGEAAAQLAAAMERSDDDPERLEEVMQRLDVWQKLKRKFGASYEAIMTTLADMQRELKELESAGERQEALGAEIATLEKQLPVLAGRLTAARAKAARALQKQIDRELGELGMNGAAMDIRLVPNTRGSEVKAANGEAVVLTGHGAEAAEFFIATNPGEEPKPLRKIASGGEISRIMLALKTVLAGRDDIPALVFDEIDVGLGGQTAAVVGEKLRRLAASHQVVCITHFAQVASHAGRHFAIEKSLREARAVSEVRPLLAAADRVEELARLLDGRVASDISRRHAKELLDACAGDGGSKKKRK